MEKIITFTLGDISGDGHREKDTFYVISNVDVSVLRRIYDELVKIHGVDFNEICSNYQESSIPPHIVRKLKSLNIASLKDTKYVDSGEFFELLVNFLKLGLKENETLRCVTPEEFCGYDDVSGKSYNFAYGTFLF